MPEQNQPITSLPIKTASGMAATDYLLGIDSAEGYQMLIQDLGDYIIQHATSSLAGQSQTIANVISGLDSKTTALYYMGAYNDANQVFVDSPVKSNCRFFLNTGGSNSPDLMTGWMIDQFKDLTTYGYQVARRTNDTKVYQRNMLNGTWSNWILQPTRTELEALNSKMRTITSGSLRDIKTSGIYYLTGGVTDKPVNNGGYYSVSVYNNDLLVGTYVSTDNYVYAIKYINGEWAYEQLASKASVDTLNSKTDIKEAVVTFVSGAGEISIPGMTWNSNAIVNIKRVTGTDINYRVYPQPTTDKLVLYARDKDDGRPADNTQLTINYLWD